MGYPMGYLRGYPMGYPIGYHMGYPMGYPMEHPMDILTWLVIPTGYGYGYSQFGDALAARKTGGSCDLQASWQRYPDDLAYRRLDV